MASKARRQSDLPGTRLPGILDSAEQRHMSAEEDVRKGADGLKADAQRGHDLLSLPLWDRRPW